MSETAGILWAVGLLVFGLVMIGVGLIMRRRFDKTGQPKDPNVKR